MQSRGYQYYYGSYGLIRGYGPLCRNMRDAEESVYADARRMRDSRGTTDRHAVLVSRVTGLCWWFDEPDNTDLSPVRDIEGKQAQYELAEIRRYEDLWGNIEDQAGLG